MGGEELTPGASVPQETPRELGWCSHTRHHYRVLCHLRPHPASASPGLTSADPVEPSGNALCTRMPGHQALLCIPAGWRYHAPCHLPTVLGTHVKMGCP